MIRNCPLIRFDETCRVDDDDCTKEGLHKDCSTFKAWAKLKTQLIENKNIERIKNTHKEFKDYRGNIVKEGTLVAYNQSGEVVMGIVESVFMKPNNNKWNPFNYLIKVKKMGGRDDGQISKVKNHLCIISIEQEEKK